MRKRSERMRKAQSILRSKKHTARVHYAHQRNTPERPDQKTQTLARAPIPQRLIGRLSERRMGILAAATVPASRRMGIELLASEWLAFRSPGRMLWCSGGVASHAMSSGSALASRRGYRYNVGGSCGAR